MRKPREALLLLNRTSRGPSYVRGPHEASLYLSAKPDESNSNYHYGVAVGDSDVYCRSDSMWCAPANEIITVEFAGECNAPSRQCPSSMSRTPE